VDNCCPAGRGCNAPFGGQACALALIESAAAQLKEAALALSRWHALQECRDSGAGRNERRFRQRSYERARDDAVIALALLRLRSRKRPRAISRPALRQRRRPIGTRQRSAARSVTLKRRG
jgi:hypothetical protein